MANGDEVVLIGGDIGIFTVRVEIALQEKGVPYQRRPNLSAMESRIVRQAISNYKKHPVLVHDSKPICEAMAILEHVDRIWREKPLLPSDPDERDSVKDWCEFIDKKVFESGRQICIRSGKQKEAAKQDFLKAVRLLEEELADKLYFGGQTVGYMDIVLASLHSWLSVFETIGGFKIDDSCPKVISLVKRCIEKQSFSRVLPDHKTVRDTVLLLVGVHSLS